VNIVAILFRPLHTFASDKPGECFISGRCNMEQP
jgi:hypothetical protein